MDVFKVFVAFLLFSIAAVVEAPSGGTYGYSSQLFNQWNQPTARQNGYPPRRQQQQQFQGHHQQRASSPRGRRRRTPSIPPPWDPIPTHRDEGTSVYGPQIPKGRKNVHFYSRNMDMGFYTLKPKWAAVMPYTPITRDSGNVKKMTTPFARMKKVAANHLLAYADFWHGDIPPDRKKWSSTDSKIKKVFSDNGGSTYQVYVHLQTTDGALEMCCNLLLRLKKVEGFAYKMGCAQAACFRIHQSASSGRNGRNIEKCYFLNIVHDITTMAYPYCLKEGV